jgi:hypothetical protein
MDLLHPPEWKPDLNEMILIFDNLPDNLNDTINNFGVLDSQFIEIEKTFTRKQVCCSPNGYRQPRQLLSV